MALLLDLYTKRGAGIFFPFEGVGGGTTSPSSESQSGKQHPSSEEATKSDESKEKIAQKAGFLNELPDVFFVASLLSAPKLNFLPAIQEGAERNSLGELLNYWTDFHCSSDGGPGGGPPTDVWTPAPGRRHLVRLLHLVYRLLHEDEGEKQPAFLISWRREHVWENLQRWGLVVNRVVRATAGGLGGVFSVSKDNYTKHIALVRKMNTNMTTTSCGPS